MSARILVTLALVALSACADTSTTVLVELSASTDLVLTELTLQVDIAGRPDGGTGPQRLGGMSPTVPSSVVLQLPDEALELTVTATAQTASGRITATSVVQSIVHQQVRAMLVLGAATGGGPSRCGLYSASDQVLACAGFESTTDMLFPVSNFGTVTLDTRRAYRGASSVRFEVDGAETTAMANAEVHQAQLPSRPTYAMREFLYVPSPLLPGGVRLLAFEQESAPYHEVAITLDAANHLVLHHAVSGGDVFKNTTSATLLPFDRWFCLELRVDWGVPPSSHVRVLVDDVPVDDLDDDTTTADTPELGLGLVGQYYYTSPGATYTLWADELVIAAQAIGCAK